MSNNTNTNPWIYGSTVPYAEPPWSRGIPSPYIKDSHRHLRHAMRQWVEEHIIPFAHEWEEATTVPHSAYVDAAKAGLLMPMAAGSRIPDEWWGRFPIMGDVRPEEWDGFHDFVIHDELMRVGGIGYVD
ncbi:Acyl-CoA dehydrogenase [Macrophomina phaseolina MS6]|uniref:Acyl-CoA dehydrogenase n=1 Tax=Macrophomina phaseolina (strain MS6) TaxID=1126212 RepID=K2RN30_MACPH|nr:Acyl-CoA dehydrogenase [Macrophomina phaseolina MS6]